jgi:hypothetical protein
MKKRLCGVCLHLIESGGGANDWDLLSVFDGRQWQKQMATQEVHTDSHVYKASGATQDCYLHS